MKNADKSIYFLEHDNKQSGLTKREHFAGLAMQGILAGTYTKMGGGHLIEDNLIKQSIIFADELLKQLEEQTP